LLRHRAALRIALLWIALRADLAKIAHLAEQRFKMIASARRKADDAGGALASCPFQRKDAVEQRGAQRPGKVIAPHAPVEAGLADRPPCTADGVEVDAELGAKMLASGRQHQLGIGEIQKLALGQVIEHAHAEVTGEVVVADPRLPHLRVLWSGADAAMAGVIGKARERLECRGDLGILEAEVAMPSLLLWCDQPAGFELGKMRACGLR